MNLNLKMILAILGMGLVTFFLRSLPFWFPLPKKYLQKLQRCQHILPTLFLSLLVVYCLADLRFWQWHTSLPLLLCSILVATLQWFWGKLFLSLSLGTGVYLTWINLFY